MSFGFHKELNKTNFVLDLIGARQEALSKNLANINTPAYVRQDVSFQEHIGKLNTPLETELSKKMGSIIPKMEGGKVDLTEELAAMQKNALFYSIASRRASMLIQEIKTVLQVGR